MPPLNSTYDEIINANIGSGGWQAISKVSKYIQKKKGEMT